MSTSSACLLPTGDDPADRLAWQGLQQHLDGCTACRQAWAASVRGASVTPERRGLPPPVPGVLIGGRYRLGAIRGEGRVGVVFEAEDLLQREPVALKVLRPELLRSKTALSTLHRELRIGRRLAHPRIGKVHDLVRDGAWSCLVMQLVEGEPLDLYLSRNAPSFEQAVAMLEPLASALQFAHELGVVHCDLKPGNLIVGADGGLTVLDFGFAQELSLDRDELEGPAGTPAYWAPEQGRGESPTPLVDVWAFGVLATELLSGKRPAEGGLSALSTGIRRALAGCLAAPPAQRYPSIRAAFDALREALSPRGRTERSCPWVDANLGGITDRERRVLVRCAVFRGGFSRAAARAVLGVEAEPDALERLSARGLLERSGAASDEKERYQLPETSVRVAEEAFCTLPERAELERRHGDWYLEQAERWSAQTMRSRRAGGARLLAERANLHVAFERALTADATRAARLLIAMVPAWLHSGAEQETLSSLAVLLDAPGLPVSMRVKLRRLSAQVLTVLGRLDPARASLRTARDEARQQGCASEEIAALLELALLEAESAQLEPAGAAAAEAVEVARNAGVPEASSEALHTCGFLALHAGRRAEARGLITEALRLHRQLGNRRDEGRALANLANLCVDEERRGEARALFERSLSIHREIGNRRHQAYVLGCCALLDLEEGLVEQALGRVERATTCAGSFGDPRLAGFTWAVAGAVNAELDRDARAEACFARASELLLASRDAGLCAFLEVLQGLLEAGRARRRATSEDERSRLLTSLQHRRASAGPAAATSADVRTALRLLQQAVDELVAVRRFSAVGSGLVE